MNPIFKSFSVALVCVSLFACSDPKNHASGYIEGEYTYISSGVDGTLFNLAVRRGQMVNKGDLLYSLDQQPERANVEVTQANIADLQAQVDFAKIQLDRQKNLYAKGATAKTNLDQAQTDYDSRTQQLAANRAQLIQTNWSLQQKTQYAPVSGQVFDTFYRVGEKVLLGHPVLAVLAPENIKVLFYIPEESLSRIKLGQTIGFTCDGCKEKTKATISYISPEAEYTPPVIYSKDTRNKLVYLVRANLPTNVAQNFHPGQPVDINVRP